MILSSKKWTVVWDKFFMGIMYYLYLFSRYTPLPKFYHLQTWNNPVNIYNNFFIWIRLLVYLSKAYVETTHINFIFSNNSVEDDTDYIYRMCEKYQKISNLEALFFNQNKIRKIRSYLDSHKWKSRYDMTLPFPYHIQQL